MARPRNPNLKPKTYRVRQKNTSTGCYDIYERTTIFDPDLGRKRYISSKLIGRLPEGETGIEKMIPVEEKKSEKTVQHLTHENFVVGDPRRKECVIYPLDLVLFVIILAQISGHTSCYAIAAFWAAHRPVFSQYFADFPQRDISHDTVRRIIMLLGENDAASLLRRLAAPLVSHMTQRVVALDGQAVRAAGKMGAGSRYTLNVYDTGNELCLEQILIGAKENEITQSCSAIANLHLEGAVVTCDALNTQKKFCGKIIMKGADYCMAVKDSHKLLREEIAAWFKTQAVSRYGVSFTTQDKAHGRDETRTVEVLPASIFKLSKDMAEEWPGLPEGCIARTVTRSVIELSGEVRSDVRYFITSLHFDPNYIGPRLARIIRAHWKIENSLHWRLDVTFSQDRTQCKNATFLKGKTVLNKVALNLLSKAQARIERETGKTAPSVPVLQARFSNPEDLPETVKQLFSPEDDE